MYKKIICVTTCLLVSNVFADSNSSAPAKTPKFLNNPAVANSRQAGSQQTFGDPAITGHKGEHYNKSPKHQNRPSVGSKQASDFLFHQDQNPVTHQNNQ